MAPRKKPPVTPEEQTEAEINEALDAVEEGAEIIDPEVIDATDAVVEIIDADGNVVNPQGKGRIYEMSLQEKRRRGIALRIAGATWETIAKETGYADASGARNAISLAIRESMIEEVEELQRVHLKRLEHILLLHWPGVNTRDPFSTQVALQVMDRIERLIFRDGGTGLTQTTNADVGVLVVDGNKDDFIAGMRRARKSIEQKARA